MRKLFALAAAMMLSSQIVLGETVFESIDAFGEWSTYYYLHPDPAKIPGAIRFFSDTLAPKFPNTRMPFTAFFSALFKKSDDLAEAAFNDISANGTENAKIFLINAFWLTDTAKSRHLLNQAKTRWEGDRIEGIVGRLIQNPPEDLMKVPVETPQTLDMLWSTFFATGDSEPVERIISVLPEAENGHGQEIIVGNAAKWSLASNSRQHKRVNEICKAKGIACD